MDTNSSNATAVRSDVYFEGVASETNSGNKNANCQRIVIATDDVPIALVNTKLDHLSDNLDTLETTADAILAKNTEIETTADAILAKNTEIETSADAILAKNTQLETLLTSIAPRTATGTLSSAVNLVDGGATSIVDTLGYRYMTLFGKATNDVDLHIQYSLTNNAGAMISLYNESPYKLQSVSSINNIITFNTTIEHMARYVRFINFSGSQINALTLFYVLSN